MRSIRITFPRIDSRTHTNSECATALAVCHDMADTARDSNQVVGVLSKEENTKKGQKI